MKKSDRSDRNKSTNEPTSQLTPLQRYLAKKKADGAGVQSNDKVDKVSNDDSPMHRQPGTISDAKPGRFTLGLTRGDSHSGRSQNPDLDKASERGTLGNAPLNQTRNVSPELERKAIEQGVPSWPLHRDSSLASGTSSDSSVNDQFNNERVSGPSSAPFNENSTARWSSDSTSASSTRLAEGLKPAGLFLRLIAVILDSLVVQAASTMVTSMVFSVLTPVFGDSIWISSDTLDHLLIFIVIYFYYGWFYSHKGASPGKLLMGMRVVRSDTGEKLNYWRAFFRETVGKLISSAMLFIGFFIAAFREDRRALHDMIFDTWVIRKR